MLVTRVIGGCPRCGGKNCFGNVSIRSDHVLRGCMSCNHSTNVWLPEIRKKIIYLDQFFLSHAFRGREQRFVDAAKRIQHISSLQLLVAPLSSVHVDETHQWRGYGGKNSDGLMEFIKATSRGCEFEPAYSIEETQIIKAFQAFLAGESPEFKLEDGDALEDDVHKWDDYFRIDVGRYIGDVELMRDLKRQCIEELVSTFENWRQSTNTFEQDVALEIRDAGKGYIEAYFKYVARVAGGDYAALFDSPVMAMVVQSMLYCLPDEAPPDVRLQQIALFFASKHFAHIPYQWLSSRLFATLKTMVKRGAYSNNRTACRRLSGFFYDIKHIATYAPYCDAFIMDQSMAALVADPQVALEQKYGVKVFSVNNWDELFAWLDTLEARMNKSHKVGLSVAYP